MKFFSKFKRGVQGFKESFRDAPLDDDLSIELDEEDISLIRNMFLSNMVPKDLSEKFTISSVAKIWYNRGYEDALEEKDFKFGGK